MESPLIGRWLRSLLAGSCALIFSNHSSAQNSPDLSRLIFEQSPSPELNLLVLNTESNDPLLVDKNQILSRATDIDQYQQSLLQLESEQGPFAAGRIELLQALGQLYQAENNHQSALKNFQEAQHILRVSKGLFTLEQAPLVKEIINSYSRLNDIESADDFQDYLYYLHRKNFSADAPEMLAATEALADWKVRSFLAKPRNYREPAQNFTQLAPLSPSYQGYYLADSESIIYLPTNDFSNPNSAFFNRSYNQDFWTSSQQATLQPELRNARKLYGSLLHDTDDYKQLNPIDQQAIQKKLANITYILKQQAESESSFTTIGNPNFQSRRNQHSYLINKGYTEGKLALINIINTFKSQAQPDPKQIAQAQLDLGDWLLSFNRQGQASKQYKEAYTTLLNSGMPPQDITAIVRPTPALHVPTFVTHEFSRVRHGIPTHQALDFKGYVDVRLSTNRNGSVKRLSTINVSPNTPKEIVSHLRTFLKQETFRPVIDDNELNPHEDLNIRYYYSY